MKFGKAEGGDRIEERLMGKDTGKEKDERDRGCGDVERKQGERGGRW